MIRALRNGGASTSARIRAELSALRQPAGILSSGVVRPAVEGTLRVAPPDTALEQAALRTLAYADVFNYPLTAAEIHRYLIEYPASAAEVEDALDATLLPGGWVETRSGYFSLAGRLDLVRVRQERKRHGERLWPRAQRYGRWLAALPYVRMAAVTGALVMDNEPGRDLDFLIVTLPGRLWLCRGMAMLLVHLARRFGDELCPNYFITTRALDFPRQDLYTAHELVQMAPLFDRGVYDTIRCLNAWAAGYLPNAAGQPRPEFSVISTQSPAGRAAEWAFSAKGGDRLESWEMRRKVAKLTRQQKPGAEAEFGPDWCKGHFGGYGHKALDGYQARLEALGL